MKKKKKKSSVSSGKKLLNNKRFLLKHPLVLPVSIFIGVLFFGLIMFVVVGGTTEGAKDKKIVNLYIDNEQQTLSTRAKTVGDLFERLEIDLLEEDIVEPEQDTQIIEDNTQINVYKARPVSIVDGDRTITLLSAQRSPRLLASEAGVGLLPEDEVYIQSIEENILENTAPEQVVVNRSKPIQLTLFGVVKQYRTTADTVQEVLEENNVVLNESETVQPANIESSVKSNMLISVNAPGIKTVSVLEDIPFASETIEEDSLEVGQRELRTAGTNGQRAVIYEIEEENGEEVSRRELQTVVVKNPVTEVYARGTKPATISASVNVSGDKASLMSAAGIAQSDFVYVDYIISKESNWRPGAFNASSGAYGLCQSLPASKMASAGGDYLTNPVTQLRWCDGYSSRYGGWQGAYNAWLAQGWW